MKEKHVGVMRACDNVIAKNPIVHVEKYQQQFSIDAFMEELAMMQFHCTPNSAIARKLLNVFWKKVAPLKCIHDGHICIYQLLDLYKSYLGKSVYDDLMMVNKFELELSTQVTVVMLFNDPHELENICCNFYWYKCKEFIGNHPSGFSPTEVTSKEGEIVYGHYIGKVEVPSSFLYQNKVSINLEGYFKDGLINVCKSVKNITWYNKLFHAKRDDMKEQPFLVKARSKHMQHFVK
eukprot:11587258-Ditylum_brightwellii.AAC.1